MSLIKKIFGDENLKTLKVLQPIVDSINELEQSIESLADKELRRKTEEFQSRLKQGQTMEDILPEAFATVREAAKRTLGQRHYDVQLIGGLILHQGKIAEMKTGEGKTLVATLPVYLNALEGNGVHVITVNDYLSRRDAVWMGQVYNFLGLSVGIINSQSQSFLYDPSHIEKDEERDEVGSYKIVYDFLRPCTKRDAYNADITYGTNNEFGFDYLRDNTAFRREDLSQREPVLGGFNYAIVDEIDSILIDEARTPLIIAMPAAESENLYEKFAGIARQLKSEEHYELDEKKRSATLTDDGIEKAEKILGIENIYTDAGIKYVHHLETAVRARALYLKDREYVVKDGEIVIVDEFTGRLQPGRRWSEGLHQAIEAKENLSVQRETRTAASVTYQNYFRMYKKLSGMTGTAESSSEEFYKVYGLETSVIPTHRPIARKDQNDLILKTEKGKYMAISKKVKELHGRGQPVLIGTVSIENNELLSSYLKQEGVPHEVLNAKQHENEGEIIAQAGKRGSVTIATNMAGRGVDIKLGGSTPTKEEYEEVKKVGGLFVLGTERHDARRIDNQLRGRAGRQGDPGETQFFVSLDDKLMRVFASDTIKGLMDKLNMPEDQPIENSIITRSLESAQKKIEGFNFDARKHVLEFDDVMNVQRQSIYATRRDLLLGDEKTVEEVLGQYVLGEEETTKVIDEKRIQLGEEKFIEIVRRMILQTIDLYWVQHLETMDYLRNSVNLRAYGQRDPLVEYRREGRRLFEDLEVAIASHVVQLVPNIGVGAFSQDEEKLKKQRERMKAVGSDDSAGGASQTVHVVDKIGRNDPCPCGSGKKYKKCGLIDAPEHKK